MSGAARARLAAFGFVGGLFTGLVVWSTQVQRNRRELFSPLPLRRLAALGFLAGQPGVETTRVLADYVNWETRPILRRRGMVLLRRMEAHLD